jgi:uncharacterized protein YjbI with pentapeptide repeats
MFRPLILIINSLIGYTEPKLDTTTGAILVAMAVIAVALPIRGLVIAKTPNEKARWILFCILGAFVLVLSIVINFSSTSISLLDRSQPKQGSSLHISPYTLTMFSFIVAGIAVYLVPKLYVRKLDIGSDIRLEKENKARATLSLVFGCVLLLMTAFAIHDKAASADKIADNGRVTDRFIQAVSQLNAQGDANLQKRLTGIKTLGQMAKDSDVDQGSVVEMLSAYVRGHSSRRDKFPQNYQTPADIQAILTLLGNRETLNREEVLINHSLSLRNANLPGADLHAGIFHKATLQRANLSGADLKDADLTDAIMYGVVLVNAKLQKVDMSSAEMSCLGEGWGYADMRGADLSEANLTETEMSRADLRKANLTDADLTDAHLGGVDLTGANLSGARLYGTDLRHANLTGTIGLTQEQLNSANLDYETKVSPPLVLK